MKKKKARREESTTRQGKPGDNDATLNGKELKEDFDIDSIIKGSEILDEIFDALMPDPRQRARRLFGLIDCYVNAIMQGLHAYIRGKNIVKAEEVILSTKELELIGVHNPENLAEKLREKKHDAKKRWQKHYWFEDEIYYFIVRTRMISHYIIPPEIKEELDKLAGGERRKRFRELRKKGQIGLSKTPSWKVYAGNTLPKGVRIEKAAFLPGQSPQTSINMYNGNRRNLLHALLFCRFVHTNTVHTVSIYGRFKQTMFKRPIIIERYY